jgi:hypothetical protein
MNICYRIKILIRNYYKKNPHTHIMEHQHYIENTQLGFKKHSRLICKKCGYIDYDSPLTFHKKPDDF